MAPRDFIESERSLPPTIGGRYRPLRFIGRGGMGAVYAVEHVHTGEHLALKLLSRGLVRDAGIVERFKREARVFARIRSEYVVRILDADVAPELENAPFLTMELLEGEDLAQIAHREGPQPPERVARWMAQVARGLARAHAIGIVHRDLKPANLFLTRTEDGEERIKILDFGVAKMLSDVDSPSTTGSALGTPRFMSPEQVRGKDARLGPPADQWALGMLVFDLLTSHRYWHSENTTETIAQILFGELTPPSNRGCAFGPAFDAWFERSCDRDPDKRWPSVIEQGDALVAALAGAHRLDMPLDAPPPASRDLPATAPAVRVARPVASPAPPTIDAETPGKDSTGTELSADSTPSPRPQTSARGARVVVAALVVTAITVAGVVAWRVRAPTDARTDATTSTSVPPAPSPSTNPKASSAPSMAPVVSAAASATPVASASTPERRGGPPRVGAVSAPSTVAAAPSSAAPVPPTAPTPTPTPTKRDPYAPRL